MHVSSKIELIECFHDVVGSKIRSLQLFFTPFGPLNGVRAFTFSLASYVLEHFFQGIEFIYPFGRMKKKGLFMPGADCNEVQLRLPPAFFELENE